MVDPELIERALANTNGGRLVVGLSGGPDSVVLLDLVVRAVLEVPGLARREIAAVHVNHGLVPHADAWEAFCRRLCAERSVALEVCPVTVLHAGNLEANARDARYQAFAACLEPRDTLLLAHHFDDQVETWLFRLLRGNAARLMPARRELGPGTLVRPLLDVTRVALLAYAESRSLGFIEDPSNQDTAFSRNFLRHEILPRLREREPGFDAKVRASMHLEREREELARALGAVDLERAGGPVTLGVPELLQLTAARQRNVVRHWFAMRGFGQPGHGALDQLLQELQQGRQVDLSTGDARVALHQARLFILPRTLPLFPPGPVYWHGEAELSFETGTLTASRAPRGIGVSELLLRPGRTGERFSWLPAGPRRALRDLLREAGVPPWDRPRMPLLYAGDELVGVPGYGSAAGLYQASERVADESEGWVFHWRAAE